MFAKTDSERAPWFLIPGNDKQYARIQVLKETIAHIEKEAARRGLHLTNGFEEKQGEAKGMVEQTADQELETKKEKKKRNVNNVRMHKLVEVKYNLIREYL